MARHSLRSALRTLQGEGIVQIEPNRGARVKSLSPEDVRGLSELRIALEVEAARMALERHGGGCPGASTGPLTGWPALCRRAGRPGAPWPRRTRRSTTRSCSPPESPRLAAAHQQAGAELRLFVLQLPPSWTLERMASEHLELVEALESEGAEVLRPHIEESTRALLEG